MSPVYEYRCQHGHVIERVARMDDAPDYVTERCPYAVAEYNHADVGRTRDVPVDDVSCTFERIMSVNAKPQVSW